MKNWKLSNAPWHLAAFTLYFPLALYVLNIEETVFASTQRAFLFALFFSLAALAVGRLVFRDWRKAAAMASVIVLLFFTYGHVQNISQNVSLGAFMIGRHRYLLPFWLGLAALGWLWIRKAKTETVSLALNTVGATLLVLTSIQIASFQARANRPPVETASLQPTAGADRPAELPDVYYIILDAYSRQDVLQNVYHLDNREFIQQLEAMGFVIPSCTQSNYDDTVSSLMSSLNMAYLEDLGFTIFPEAHFSKTDMEAALKHSAVRRRFEEMGYATVTFKSVYPQLDITDSTYYYDFFLEGDQRGTETLSFYYLFLRTTALLPLVEYGEAHPAMWNRLPNSLAAWLPTGRLLTARNYRQYQQNLYLLDVLKNMPDVPGPKFVYAHLFTTHQPFVFHADGSFRLPGPEDGRAYREQVIFTNTAMLDILQSLIERSARPPIIIVQGDHSYIRGPRRIRILNAYYLPGGGDLVYPAITPVNTFRLIFEQYFGDDYELLEDISYISTTTGDRLIYSRVKGSCVKVQP